jgi:hypothetical protein
MGYHYGGRLCCGEYLLEEDGSVREIRRRETPQDLLESLLF